MTTALHWHQHPGNAVRWALLFAVLAAHAAVLWFWPIGRPQAVLQQITPVRVVMVEKSAAPRRLEKSAIEAPPLPPAAAARQSADAVAPRGLAQAIPPNLPQAAQPAMQQATQPAAQSNALAPPPAPALTQTNAAPMREPSGESSASTVAAVSATGNTGNTGSAMGGASARVGGPATPAQTLSAAPAPGIGSAVAAPSTAKTMQDLCPHTVKAVPPARATQAGLGGMVLARASIQGGKVRRVEILKSEPGGLYDAAVRAAMAQYVCRDQGGLEILAEQLFEFKVVE